MVQPAAHTELTIAFIRIIESIMCLLCLITHINSLENEEPMPHIVLFCGTFGGFFILSLAKLLVPISGQLSPPGVDLIFCLLGFILFYVAACAAMFFVQRDPHLVAVNGQPTSTIEETHPFFQRCVRHAILSIATGTLFLMHAVISADRLTSALRGVDEDIERELEENDIDIFPDDTISLHLFFLNWLILIWNTACCESIRKLFKRCNTCCIQYYRRKHSVKNIPRRRQYRRARMLLTTELERINGIAVSNIAPEEFVRNPRRTLAYNSLLAYVENENFNKSSFVNNDETPQPGPSKQRQTERKMKPKSVVVDEKRNTVMGKQSVIGESGEGHIMLPDRKQTRTFIHERTSSNKIQQDTKSISSVYSFDSFLSDMASENAGNEGLIEEQFIRNKEFESYEDIPKTLKKKINIIDILKKPFNKADKGNKLDKSPSSIPRQRSFTRNKAFESVVGSTMSQTKESFDTAASSKSKTKNRSLMYFTRNKEFGSEDKSKLFKWIKRRSESVVQNVDEETIPTMEVFSPKLTLEFPSAKNLQVIENRANSEVEISTVGFKSKSIHTRLLQRKTSPTQLQIQNQEALQSTIFEPSLAASNFKQNIVPDAEFILCEKEPKTTLKNKKQKNEDIPTFPTSSMIPYILMNTIDKDNNIAKTEQTSSSTSMKKVAGSIPPNKISESTSEIPNTDVEYRCIFPVLDSTSYIKEVANLIPSSRISESTSKNETDEAKYQAAFPVLDSSYIKEVALIPSNRISENTSKNETEFRSTFPALDSTSYMKEVANLIPSNRISESASKNETIEEKYQASFPVLAVLDSTSYLQTIAGLIPSNRNTENVISSRKEEKKKKQTDDIEKRSNY